MPVRINPDQPSGGTGVVDSNAVAVHNPLSASKIGYRSSTPIPDLYTTAAVFEALKQWLPSDMFLLNNFFAIERFFESRFLIVDSKRAKRVLAPVVSRYHPGVVVKRPATESNVYEVPKLAPFRVTNLGQLDVRSMGGVAQNRSGDASDVFAELLADDTEDLGDIIFRRIEYFASQILTTGKVRYRLDGSAFEEFGYGPNIPGIYNPPIRWDDHDQSDPIDDLKKVRSMIIADTGIAPDIVVFSETVADHFIKNREVRDQLNSLHLVGGMIEPKRPQGTAQWLGRLLLPSLEMWSYGDSYIDELDGVSVAPMLSPHMAIVGTTQPSGYCYYGSILQLDASGFEESHTLKVVPRLHYDVRGEVSQYRLQSRPCLVPRDGASWMVINALTPTRRANGPPPAIPTEKTEPRPTRTIGRK